MANFVVSLTCALPTLFNNRECISHAQHSAKRLRATCGGTQYELVLSVITDSNRNDQLGLSAINNFRLLLSVETYQPAGSYNNKALFNKYFSGYIAVQFFK